METVNNSMDGFLRNYNDNVSQCKDMPPSSYPTFHHASSNKMLHDSNDQKQQPQQKPQALQNCNPQEELHVENTRKINYKLKATRRSSKDISNTASAPSCMIEKKPILEQQQMLQERFQNFDICFDPMKQHQHTSYNNDANNNDVWSTSTSAGSTHNLLTTVSSSHDAPDYIINFNERFLKFQKDNDNDHNAAPVNSLLSRQVSYESSSHYSSQNSWNESQRDSLVSSTDSITSSTDSALSLSWSSQQDVTQNQGGGGNPFDESMTVKESSNKSCIHTSHNANVNVDVDAAVIPSFNLSQHKLLLRSGSSSLPDADSLIQSGHILSRISLRSIFLKKWKKTFWVQFGPCELLIFRCKEDADSWLYNPYHTSKVRDALIKLRVNFAKELDWKDLEEIVGSGYNYASSYTASKITKKKYSGSYYNQFKLERWMEAGSRVIIAAFGSPIYDEVTKLQKAIHICINASIEAKLAEYNSKSLEVRKLISSMSKSNGPVRGSYPPWNQF